jgi:hypothetical protein
VLRRRPGSWWTRGVVACAPVLGLLLAGCSGGTVEVDAPDLDAADAETCAALLGDLPGELAGLTGREVSDPDVGAAWGDPAMVLTCGAGRPDGFDRFSQCQEVDGVGWFVPPEQEEDLDADILLTAVGFEPAVSLLVPAEHRGGESAAALTALAGPVKDHLELVDACA